VPPRGRRPVTPLPCPLGARGRRRRWRRRAGLRRRTGRRVCGFGDGGRLPGARRRRVARAGRTNRGGDRRLSRGRAVPRPGTRVVPALLLAACREAGARGRLGRAGAVAAGGRVLLRGQGRPPSGAPAGPSCAAPARLCPGVAGATRRCLLPCTRWPSPAARRTCWGWSPRGSPTGRSVRTSTSLPVRLRTTSGASWPRRERRTDRRWPLFGKERTVNATVRGDPTMQRPYSPGSGRSLGPTRIRRSGPPRSSGAEMVVKSRRRRHRAGGGDDEPCEPAPGRRRRNTVQRG
jgi:hypothetical protein